MNIQRFDGDPDGAPHPFTVLALGQAALQTAFVTPLGLSIRPNGEWQFFQFIALPGHPHPGNSRRGYSHPAGPQALPALKVSKARQPPTVTATAPVLDVPAFANHAAAKAWLVDLWAWLWPGHRGAIEIARKSRWREQIAEHHSLTEIRIVTYTETGDLLRYGDDSADEFDLEEIVLLRRLGRVELMTIAAQGNGSSLKRAHEGGSCWEDYPAAGGKEIENTKTVVLPWTK